MNLYKYSPSGAAAMIFFVAFVIGGAWHLYIIIRKRAWYFTPMLIGCICKLLLTTQSLPPSSGIKFIEIPD